MTTIKLDEDFDFGFTSVGEGDIKLEELSELSDLTDKYKANLEKMHKLITPLIKNLMANSDKSYIHWPNRQEKLIEFQKQLDSLLNVE